MIKKIVSTGLLIVATTFISNTSLMGADTNLKADMQLLNTELREIQQGFISSDKDGVETSIKTFAKHVQELLGNEKRITEMLPKDKKTKSSEAVMSAKIIAHNVQIIQDAIDNKFNQSERIRREESQRAYTYIEHACFRCHNIVRDVK
jgi:hypothetical protein